MKFSPQATLKWAAQRMHSEVIRLVMHNANTTPPLGESFVQASGTKAQVLALLNHTELQRYKPRLK